MAILDFQTDYAGVSCHPHRISILCNDDYATITAAGYINTNLMGISLDIGDFVFISYGTNSFSSAMLTISKDAGGIITLVPYDIAPSSIVNADIAANAAIDFSKLAPLASTTILVGSGVSVATSRTVTGDVTLSNTGVTAIGAAKVLLAMLAPGISPSHIVKYAGKVNNGGGSATITLSIAGVVAGDIAFVNVQASTNAVSVQKVTPGTDQIVVLLSGDPGASTVISYQALRAAA